MKKHVLSVVRSVIFLAILAVSLIYINKFLTLKYLPSDTDWPTTSTYQQFYQMEENSIDVLFLGPSCMANAISPQEIYNEYGIRSYNLGSEQQTPFISYYWLREALRFQDIKCVYLDITFLFNVHNEYPLNVREGLIRKCFDEMHWSEVKTEAIREICKYDPDQTAMSYYFTNMRYHSRWTDLKSHDFRVEDYGSDPLKGFAPLNFYSKQGYTPFVPDGTTELQPTHPIMQEYVDKIVALCKEKGITLIFTSLPGVTMNSKYNNTVTTYAKEHGIDYYNLCEKENFLKLGTEGPREYAIYHANLWGAIKISRFVGNLLKETYHIEPVKDEQYEETKAFYEDLKTSYELSHIDDLDEYLAALKDDRYTIFVIGTMDETNGLTEKNYEGLKALGLKADFSKLSYRSYCAVIDPENGITEKADQKNAVTISGSTKDRSVDYVVTSGGKFARAQTVAKIDYNTYSLNRAGLTFVVYDRQWEKTIDTATFGTDKKNVGKVVR